MRLSANGHFPVGLARTVPAYFPGKFYAVDLADKDATEKALKDIFAK
jgi:hypothetical protein